MILVLYKTNQGEITLKEIGNWHDGVAWRHVSRRVKVEIEGNK
jgi:hypothetical protein